MHREIASRICPLSSPKIVKQRLINSLVNFPGPEKDSGEIRIKETREKTATYVGDLIGVAICDFLQRS